MLKAIGYWITDLRDEFLPAPQELVGVMPRDQRTWLAEYLAAGMPYEGSMGYAWCRFPCGIDFPHMGSHDLADGT